MIAQLYGLRMQVDGITIHLWSPWRSSRLENRIFEAIAAIAKVPIEKDSDELHFKLANTELWNQAVQTTERILKGWQEESSESHNAERRSWRWLIEADTDANGYDMQSEASCFWAFLRLSIDRGGPGEADKGEDLDLQGLGVSFWNKHD